MEENQNFPAHDPEIQNFATFGKNLMKLKNLELFELGNYPKTCFAGNDILLTVLYRKTITA